MSEIVETPIASQGSAVGARRVTRRLRQEFARFYADSFRSVYVATYGYAGSREQALDATQEGFSRAWARWRRLRRYGWATAWVATTAINAARRQNRRTRREVVALEHHQSIQQGPSTVRPDIVRALQKLPPRQREAIVLHYIADCPVAVVAELMNVAEGTVKAHLAGARASLSVDLSDYAVHPEDRKDTER